MNSAMDTFLVRKFTKFKSKNYILEFDLEKIAEIGSEDQMKKRKFWEGNNEEMLSKRRNFYSEISDNNNLTEITSVRDAWKPFDDNFEELGLVEDLKEIIWRRTVERDLDLEAESQSESESKDGELYTKSAAEATDKCDVRNDKLAQNTDRANLESCVGSPFIGRKLGLEMDFDRQAGGDSSEETVTHTVGSNLGGELDALGWHLDDELGDKEGLRSDESWNGAEVHASSELDDEEGRRIADELGIEEGLHTDDESGDEQGYGENDEDWKKVEGRDNSRLEIGKENGIEKNDEQNGEVWEELIGEEEDEAEAKNGEMNDVRRRVYRFRWICLERGRIFNLNGRRRPRLGRGGNFCRASEQVSWVKGDEEVCWRRHVCRAGGRVIQARGGTEVHPRRYTETEDHDEDSWEDIDSVDVRKFSFGPSWLRGGGKFFFELDGARGRWFSEGFWFLIREEVIRIIVRPVNMGMGERWDGNIRGTEGVVMKDEDFDKETYGSEEDWRGSYDDDATEEDGCRWRSDEESEVSESWYGSEDESDADVGDGIKGLVDRLPIGFFTSREVNDYWEEESQALEEEEESDLEGWGSGDESSWGESKNDEDESEHDGDSVEKWNWRDGDVDRRESRPGVPIIRQEVDLLTGIKYWYCERGEVNGKGSNQKDEHEKLGTGRLLRVEAESFVPKSMAREGRSDMMRETVGRECVDLEVGAKGLNVSELEVMKAVEGKVGGRVDDEEDLDMEEARLMKLIEAAKRDRNEVKKIRLREMKEAVTKEMESMAAEDRSAMARENKERKKGRVKRLSERLAALTIVNGQKTRVGGMEMDMRRLFKGSAGKHVLVGKEERKKDTLQENQLSEEARTLRAIEDNGESENVMRAGTDDRLEARNGYMRWEARRRLGAAGLETADIGLGSRVERREEGKCEERIDSGKLENDGEKDFGDGGNNHAYFNENSKREGELDGNTVFWEYKKG